MLQGMGASSLVGCFCRLAVALPLFLLPAANEAVLTIRDGSDAVASNDTLDLSGNDSLAFLAARHSVRAAQGLRPGGDVPHRARAAGHLRLKGAGEKKDARASAFSSRAVSAAAGNYQGAGGSGLQKANVSSRSWPEAKPAASIRGVSFDPKVAENESYRPTQAEPTGVGHHPGQLLETASISKESQGIGSEADEESKASQLDNFIAHVAARTTSSNGVLRTVIILLLIWYCGIPLLCLVLRCCKVI